MSYGFLNYLETHKKQYTLHFVMKDKKTMPICLSPDELKIIRAYAKRFKMTDYSQAIEKIASEIKG